MQCGMSSVQGRRGSRAAGVNGTRSKDAEEGRTIWMLFTESRPALKRLFLKRDVVARRRSCSHRGSGRRALKPTEMLDSPGILGGLPSAHNSQSIGRRRSGVSISVLPLCLASAPSSATSAGNFCWDEGGGYGLHQRRPPALLVASSQRYQACHDSRCQRPRHERKATGIEY
jgi:hypothetical protein